MSKLYKWYESPNNRQRAAELREINMNLQLLYGNSIGTAATIFFTFYGALHKAIQDGIDLKYHSDEQMLSTLQRLYLSHNNVHYIDPQAFIYFKRLVELDLSFNNIASFPTILFPAPHTLLYINLNANKLTNLDRKAFSALINLRSLSLDGNVLTFNNVFSELPESISNLSIEYNYITRRYFIQQTIPNLKHLSLQGNNLTVIMSTDFIRF